MMTALNGESSNNSALGEAQSISMAAVEQSGKLSVRKTDGTSWLKNNRFQNVTATQERKPRLQFVKMRPSH